MVLGELIEDESSKITGHRIQDVEGPKIERPALFPYLIWTDLRGFWTSSWLILPETKFH